MSDSIFSQFDLELDKAVDEIKKSDAKRVLLHVPDGIKAKSNEIVDYIEKNVEGVDVLVWAGSCYGACDLPIESKNAGVDLMIHWGHSGWRF